MGNDQKELIVIYENDYPNQVALQFAQKHNLGEMAA